MDKKTPFLKRVKNAFDAFAGRATIYPSTTLPPTDPSLNAAGSFQSPGVPLQPILDNQGQRAIRGRQYDFPSATNLYTQPRYSETTTFEQLRGLSTGCEILRLVIETRKDEVARQKWSITSSKGLTDPRIKEITDFLMYPDGEHPFSDWARQLVEELCVTDAAAIYPVLSYTGKLLSLDLIDGATIDRRIDYRGRTPQPPYVAYQQVIKGVIVSNFTRDELIYAPRNRRINKLYGFSPTEQILIAVNTAIRKAIYQLTYYTQGSIADLMFECPPDWNMTQIKEFNDWWQDSLSGDMEQRTKVQFLPNGAKPLNTKEAILKDQFDEWLARIVCFAFGISNIPFITNMNRSVSETAQETQKLEGLNPTLTWLESILDRVIHQYFGYTDLNFKFLKEVAVDPATQSKLEDTALKNGTLTINESRATKNLPPVDGGDVAFVLTAAGCVPVADIVKESNSRMAAKLPPPTPSVKATPPAKKE